jgi:hypothetical protein
MAAALVLAAFVVFRLSPNRAVADSFYSTLLSWSVMTTGSVHVESFLGDAAAMRRMPGFVPEWGRPYQIEPAGGHLLYWYPPAPSFLAVPLVAGAAAFGLTPLGPDGRYDPVRDIALHGWLGPAVAAAIVGVLFLIAAELLPLPAAAVATIVAALGSPIWSTLSRGMSSNTWHVLLLSFAALEMLRAAHRGREIHAARLATLLALAYLSRPATSVTIACVTVWMLIRHPRRFVVYAVTGAAWAALFFAYSFVQFGVALPSYYRLAARLSPEWIWSSATGTLFSPSRGLLVYSPIVLWVGWILARYRRALRFPDLATVACACIGGTFLATTTWRVWWGGHSYGPRLSADFIPWIFLLAVVALDARRDVIGVPSAMARRRLELAVGVLLGIASATLHAPGALQVQALLWNERLGPEQYEPPLLWDWRYPQFLAAYRMPPRFMGPPALNAPQPPKD